MRRVVAVLFLLICLAGLCMAQNTNSGDIRGTVMDGSGAVIAGAKITVTNLDTGVVKEYVTNNSGIYDTASIVPGTYTVTVAKEGFQQLILGPFTLRIGVMTVDGKLQVGSLNEKIEVTSTPELLQTETSDQAVTFETNTISKLPQTGSNWANFAVLLPGASGAPSSGQGVSNPGTGVAINGNLPYNASFLADGASSTLPHSANVDTSVFETISEVQINTSTFSAQYGSGGAVFNQVTKGGTRKFHGAAYEHLQNDALKARSYFDDPTAPKPTLRFNEFGGSFSGPIIKDKLFFYFNFDKAIDNESWSGTTTIPTLPMREGNFAGFPTIYQMMPDGSRAPYLNNQLTNMDPVALNYEKMYPSPNRSGDVNAEYPGIVTNNYYYVSRMVNPSISYFGRLDYDVTPKHRITFSISEGDNNGSYPNEYPCPLNCMAGDVAMYGAQVSDVWTASPTFINEFRFGFKREGNWFTPASLGQGYPAKLGLQYAKADVLPDVYFPWPMDGLTANSNDVLVENVFEPSDVVTWIRGKHILHFGGELWAAQDNSTPWGNIQAGEFNFQGLYTSSLDRSPDAPQSGDPYADFLMGYVSSWSANNQPAAHASQYNPQLFIQDDIKLRPNLTINLGLRYQIQGGWSEKDNQIGSFDPTIMNDATGTLGAMWFAKNGSRTQLQQTVNNIFLPRAGFSWSPEKNTTVRGGFGIYANNWSIDTYGNGLGLGSGMVGSISDSTNGVTPVVRLSAVDPVLPYVASATSPSSYNGQDVYYNPYHTPVPKIYQWSFGVQREMGPNTVAEVSYVGSHGTNLPFPVNYNQVPQDKLGPDDAAFRPYPQFGNINTDTHNAISNYNALQAQIQKRFSKGLSFSANYTWSHMLDEQDSSGWGGHGGNQNYQNAYEPGANYGDSNFDIRHMLKGSVVYDLPVGKGKLLGIGNSILNTIVGGWETAATMVVQSGNPFNVVWGGTNNSYMLGGSWYPNVVGDPFKAGSVAANPTCIAPSEVHSIDSWYNPCAFMAPAPGTFGDSGRNTLRGPMLSEINFSLGKEFKLREGMGLEVRADATNFLNHPSFGHPSGSVRDGLQTTINSTTVGGRNVQFSARFSF